MKFLLRSSSKQKRSFNHIIFSRMERLRPLLLWLICEPEWFVMQCRQVWRVHLPHMLANRDDSKPWPEIAKDLFLSLLRHKCLPFYYFRYGLYLKNADKEAMKKYIPDSAFYYLYLARFNQDWGLLDDKNVFHNILATSPLRQPEIVVRRQSGIWKDTNYRVLADVSQAYTALSHTEKTYFCKPADLSSGGNGVFILEARNGRLHVDEQELSEENFAHTFEGDWLIQERVLNSDDIRKFNAHALNCTRILTVQDSNGHSYALYASQKIATGKGLTDNGQNGLVYAAIDLETGRLGTYAYNEKNEKFDTHPGTNLRYDSLVLKDMHEAVEMCVQAAYYFPKCKIIGWDVALTNNGPVLIEGNSSPAITSLQRPHEGLPELISYLRGNKY